MCVSVCVCVFVSRASIHTRRQLRVWGADHGIGARDRLRCGGGRIVAGEIALNAAVATVIRFRDLMISSLFCLKRSPSWAREGPRTARIMSISWGFLAAPPLGKDPRPHPLTSSLLSRLHTGTPSIMSISWRLLAGPWLLLCAQKAYLHERNVCMHTSSTHTCDKKTCIHTCKAAYVHTCMHAYIHKSLHEFIHTCKHACINTVACIQKPFPRRYLLAYMHAYIYLYIPTSLPPSLPPYLPTSLPPYLPTSLPPYLPTSLPPYLPTYLPTYLHA